MGESQQKPVGPDLSQGVSLDFLAEGQMFVGHVGEESVILIRRGQEVFAVGAHCSHYGAPLYDGLLENQALRCPWHHACFDCKTGEATKAPALNPIPTWKTEVRNGTVFVKEKREPQPEPRTKGESQRFVIVGSGAAGHAAAEMLRRKGFAGSLVVVSEDSDLPYDRPNLSKDYLAGNAPEEWIPLRSAEFFDEQKIEFKLKSKVERLDTNARTLKLSSGESISYDKCLLAMGGSPRKPAIQGIDQPHVHFLRSLEDCRRLIPKLGAANNIVIIGAGFIGLEAASALRARKLDVTVIAPNATPLDHVFGNEVGRIIESVHRENGVQFVLKSTVNQIHPSHVSTASGHEFKADLVLVATGIAPNTALAESAGVNCENGILVDSRLQTNRPGVFAAGDIARFPCFPSRRPARIEHWVVAQRQGQVAAMNMLGENREFNEIPYFWSQQFDLFLSYIGHSAGWNEIRYYGNLAKKEGAAAYIEGSDVTAVLTVGRDRQNLELEAAMEKNDQKRIREILTQI